MEMQAKLAQIEKDRNERLKKFQQDVCERVKRTRQQKWHEQLNRSIEKVILMPFISLFFHEGYK